MLLFLHGFLGCQEDWAPLLKHFSNGVAIDFPPFETDLAKAIFEKVGRVETIIGYSAGGRIALEMQARFPEHVKRVIAFSTHPGLRNEEEKAQRRKKDQVWIDCLQQKPFSIFLKKWYDQPLFATLKSSKYFDGMLKRRLKQDPNAWSYFLRHHGLGQKTAPKVSTNAFFVYGSEDLKYAKLYHKIQAHRVEHSGHAVHLEQPETCASIIEEIIHDSS